MHVWWYGESGEKKGGTRETSRQQQQQHGFMSQRYGQPSRTKAAKQTLDNWQDGGGTWSKWPNLREVSLGEVQGAGPRRLRFQHYNAGVIQKGRTNLILPYVNEGKAIENSIRVSQLFASQSTFYFQSHKCPKPMQWENSCQMRISASLSAQLIAVVIRFFFQMVTDSFHNDAWDQKQRVMKLLLWCNYWERAGTLGNGECSWRMGQLSQKTERKGEKKLGMRKKVWKKR